MLRGMLTTRRGGIALPLSLVFFTTAATPACSKIEELTGKKSDETAKTEDKAEAKTEEKKDDKAEEKKEEAKAPEPIPVEPMLTGLDGMLAFVPDDKAEFIIVRDASVIAEYAEEAGKFMEGPLAALGASGASDPGLQQAKAGLDMAKGKTAEIIAAIAAAGLRPKEGGAILKLAGGKTVLVFAADNPNAIMDLAKAIDPSSAPAMKCKGIEGHTGWNACADDQATVDGYKPATDPAPVRTLLGDRLPGVDLDEANVLMNVSNDGKQIAGAIATLPGLVHMAVAMPDGPEMAQLTATLAPGEAKTLSQVQAGAGFLWLRMNPAMITAAAGSGMGDAPPEVQNSFKSLTGEVMIAGEVDPGGVYLQAGMADTAGFAPVVDKVLAEKDKLPPTIDGIPDAKVSYEKTQIQGGGATIDAFHVAIAGIKEADVLKAYAGINPDAWAFAHDSILTIALGPDAANVGKLIDGGGGGPHADMLAALPHQLADAFGKNEVSFAVHLPVDFLQGAPLRKVIDAALKSSTEVTPAQLDAALSFLAPLSSATAWIAQPGGKPVVHIAVQGIGNRATDEGKAALEAARKVAAGGDPSVEFGTLASTYGSSPMAFAYHARAGDQGPGSLVGSGVGALALAGAVGYARMQGAANPTLAEDLGVKPDAPPPPLEIPTKPVAPVHEDPKKTPKKDPKKVDPKPVEPPKPKEDPKPVEPPKPTPDPKTDPKKPPKPTPDPKKPTPTPDPKKDPVKPVRPGFRPPTPRKPG